MKKTVKILCTLLFAAGAFPAAAATDDLWEQELKPEQVVARLQKCEFLPLHFTKHGGFDSPEQKAKFAELAVDRSIACKSYAAYFNAAVIYFTPDGVYSWDEEPSFTERDAANALRFADKAISLSPQAPHMYFVRAEIQAVQGAEWNDATGRYDIKSHEAVRDALSDYDKVAQINPLLAPFHKMALLAFSLKQPKRAEAYLVSARAQEKALAQQKQREFQKQIKRYLESLQWFKKAEIRF